LWELLMKVTRAGGQEFMACIDKSYMSRQEEIVGYRTENFLF